MRGATYVILGRMNEFIPLNRPNGVYDVFYAYVCVLDRYKSSNGNVDAFRNSAYTQSPISAVARVSWALGRSSYFPIMRRCLLARHFFRDGQLGERFQDYPALYMYVSAWCGYGTWGG